MLRLVSLLALAAPLAAQEADDTAKPFPENRVRDFCAEQARHFLRREDPLPPILPQFPGLDGGAWGHWGQNPEADNFDHRLNEVETGGMDDDLGELTWQRFAASLHQPLGLVVED